MKKRRKKVVAIFPKTKNLARREWGKERLVALIPKKISLKLLTIEKGKKGGLQYHHKKNECGYLIKGRLLIRYDNGKGKLKKRVLKAGSSFHFPPGAIHQEEALSKCEIIEASTPHFNDRVRVEKKYGINFFSGLKSTLKKNVILK